jgi:hypothetical protein
MQTVRPPAPAQAPAAAIRIVSNVKQKSVIGGSWANGECASNDTLLRQRRRSVEPAIRIACIGICCQKQRYFFNSSWHSGFVWPIFFATAIDFFLHIDNTA